MASYTCIASTINIPNLEKYCINDFIQVIFSNDIVKMEDGIVKRTLMLKNLHLFPHSTLFVLNISTDNHNIWSEMFVRICDELKAQLYICDSYISYDDMQILSSVLTENCANTAPLMISTYRGNNTITYISNILISISSRFVWVDDLQYEGAWFFALKWAESCHHRNTFESRIKYPRPFMGMKLKNITHIGFISGQPKTHVNIIKAPRGSPHSIFTTIITTDGEPLSNSWYNHHGNLIALQKSHIYNMTIV